MDPPRYLEMLVELHNALLRYPLTILDKKPLHLGRICLCDVGAVEHAFYEEHFYSAQLTFCRRNVEFSVEQIRHGAPKTYFEEDDPRTKEVIPSFEFCCCLYALERR